MYCVKGGRALFFISEPHGAVKGVLASQHGVWGKPHVVCMCQCTRVSMRTTPASASVLTATLPVPTPEVLGTALTTQGQLKQGGELIVPRRRLRSKEGMTCVLRR